MDVRTSQIALLDKDGTVTKTVTVRELTGREAMNADGMAGISGANQAFRAFMAITEIDGAQVAPADTKTQVEARIDGFSMREYDQLVQDYSKTYILDKESLAQMEKMRGLLSS